MRQEDQDLSDAYRQLAEDEEYFEWLDQMNMELMNGIKIMTEQNRLNPKLEKLK